MDTRGSSPGLGEYHCSTPRASPSEFAQYSDYATPQPSSKHRNTAKHFVGSRCSHADGESATPNRQRPSPESRPRRHTINSGSASPSAITRSSKLDARASDAIDESGFVGHRYTDSGSDSQDHYQGLGNYWGGYGEESGKGSTIDSAAVVNTPSDGGRGKVPDAGGGPQLLALRCWQSVDTAEMQEVCLRGYDESNRENTYSRRQRRQGEAADERGCDIVKVERERIHEGPIEDSGDAGGGCRRRAAGTQEQRKSRPRPRAEEYVTKYGPLVESYPCGIGTYVAKSNVQSTAAASSSFPSSCTSYHRRVSSPDLGGNNTNGVERFTNSSGSGDYVPSWADRATETRKAREGEPSALREVGSDPGGERDLGHGGGVARENGCFPTPDPNLLSTLKRGGSRNTRWGKEGISGSGFTEKVLFALRYNLSGCSCDLLDREISNEIHTSSYSSISYNRVLARDSRCQQYSLFSR